MQRGFFLYLIEKISEKIPPKKSLANELMGILQVNRSTVYKKIRGDTAFTMEEVLTLAQTYEISIDNWLFQDSSKLLIEYSFDLQSHNKPTDYLKNLQSGLEYIQSLGRTEIWYTAFEWPVFWYMFFPELLVFKMFAWSKGNWKQEHVFDSSFEPQRILEEYPEIEKYRIKLLNLYLHLGATEIWPNNLPDQFISQIKIALDSGYIKQSIATGLIDQIQEVLKLQYEMLTLGVKFHPETRNRGANFDVYLNEMTISNDLVLVRNAKHTIAWVSIDNPHYAKTDNPLMVDHLYSYVEGLKEVSTKISRESEQRRRKLYDQMDRKLSDLRASI
ncbi:MAG: helix-turn-helix domain-containing protein [Saprospiraceae bacterium]